MARVFAFVAFLIAAPAAFAAQPKPYEAVYDLTVKNWKLPGEIVRVAGSQIVRVERGCADWVLAGALQLEASTTNGAMRFQTEVQSVEAADGTRLRFKSATRANGKPIAEIAGVASRPAPGQAGRVALSAPDQQTLPLPPDALFPVAAFRWSATQWERGEKNANYVLFDGTAPEPVRVFELLTGSAGLPSPPPDGDLALLAGRAWRTSGSFHAYEGAQAEPLTTLTQNVFPSGVASELSLDLGFAEIALRLSRIRALAEPSC